MFLLSTSQIGALIGTSDALSGILSGTQLPGTRYTVHGYTVHSRRLPGPVDGHVCGAARLTRVVGTGRHEHVFASLFQVWVLGVFLLSGKYRRVPHFITTCLIVSQVSFPRHAVSDWVTAVVH